MNPIRSLACCVLLALTAGSASADVLVDYKMTAFGAALNSTATASPTTTATNVTATTIVNQTGGTFVGTFNYKGGTDRATSWATTAASDAATYADAFAKGSYITFSITPTDGFALNLTSITFEAASGSASASDRAFYLVTAASPGAFSSSSTVLSTDRTTTGGGSIPLQSGTGGVDTIPQSYSVSLTGLGAITTTQYFRFYLQTPTASQSLTFDNIVINGTVSAVPEPSTYALLAGGALLGFTLCLRRTRRSASA